MKGDFVESLNLKAKSLAALWKSPDGWLKYRLFAANPLYTFSATTDRPWGRRSTAAIGFCLIGGALQVCDGNEKRAIILARRLQRRIRKLFPTRLGARAWSVDRAWDDVVTFNNSAFTTFEDIQKLVHGVRTPSKLK
jgi:hypothetical protein